MDKGLLEPRHAPPVRRSSRRGVADSPLPASDTRIATALAAFVTVAVALGHAAVFLISSHAWATDLPAAIDPPDSIHIGLPPVMGRADGVKDPLFAILVALLSDGHYGTLTGERIREELKRRKVRSNLPHQTVREVTRLPVTPGRTAVVRVEFEKDLKLPIPFSILGYRPGSFSVSRVCFFREWILDQVTLEFQDDPRDPDSIWQVELTDVHLLGLVDGEVDIDIHGWLDFLMGSRLGDTRITGLMLCRHRGRWVGIAMGYSPDNQGRSGVFDFERDSIAFPSPSELRPVGRRMRGRMEALMARWEHDNIPRAVTGGKMRLIEGLVHEGESTGDDDDPPASDGSGGSGDSDGSHDSDGSGGSDGSHDSDGSGGSDDSAAEP